MRLYLKQWYIHKMYGWRWEELENYERIFENFEIISDYETNNKRVGYLLAYTEKALKVLYIDYKNEIKTRYIPISAVCVIDESASMLTQCLLYKKLNRKDQKEKTVMIVKEYLKHASVWYDGYLLDNKKYN